MPRGPECRMSLEIQIWGRDAAPCLAFDTFHIKCNAMQAMLNNFEATLCETATVVSIVYGCQVVARLTLLPASRS